MPAQAIALIVIKTVTTKGNIMKKYPINIDVELFNTIGTMHGFDMAAKSKIVIESIGRRTDFLRRCFR